MCTSTADHICSHCLVQLRVTQSGPLTPDRCIMDASALLFALHGRLLRRVCSFSNRHFTGLTSAGRALRMPSALRKKLIRLDAARAYILHITDIKAEHLYAEVGAVLDDLVSIAARGDFDRTTLTASLASIPSRTTAATATETQTSLMSNLIDVDDDEHGRSPQWLAVAGSAVQDSTTHTLEICSIAPEDECALLCSCDWALDGGIMRTPPNERWHLIIVRGAKA